MPFHIAQPDGRIEVTLTGALTVKDLRGAISAVAAIEGSTSPVPDRLIDLSASTGLQLDFPAIHEIATQRRAIMLANPIKSAIVAPEAAHVGFARMFQTLLDHPLITVKIFPDRDSALAWLAAS